MTNQRISQFTYTSTITGDELIGVAINGQNKSISVGLNIILNHLMEPLTTKLYWNPKDDAAHVNMGGNWRMSTTAELQKLATISNEWTTENSVYGRKWTSGNYTLFLPAAGYRYKGSFSDLGSYCFIWSSSLRSSLPNYAYRMLFSSSNIDDSYYFPRCYGYSVRCVASLQD